MFCWLSRRSVLTAGLAMGALIGSSVCVQAHDGDDPHHAPVKVADEVAWRPTANPDRIVLTWVTEPATSQAVTWRTDTSVTRAVAQIAIAEDGPLFVAGAKQHDAGTTPFESDLGTAHYHTINFTGLTPETKYVYRAGDGVNWSEWSHFTTASEQSKPFTFVYFGDAQNDLKSHWSRVVREAFKDAPRASFLLHAGDLINQATRDAEWGEWFYSQGFISRTMPCIAVPGNHEYPRVTDAATGAETRELTQYWQRTFAFPENGPERAREAVYWMDYQGTRFVAMNSNEDWESQAEWLDGVLADNPNRWTLITFHHPIYSSKAGRDNPVLRDLWQPIFDKYKVDLVLTGHDHTYARSRLMTHQSEQNVATGVRKQSEESGTVYVVSVSGPKMYDLGRRPFMRRAAEDTQLYQIITIDGDELRYEARTATGRPYDAFTLKKRDGQANELVDRIPDTPENRREQTPERVASTPKIREGDNVMLAEPTVKLLNPEAVDQDDLCIWQDINTASRSTVITSDKSADRLFVYDLTGNLLQSIEVAQPGNIDIRSGFSLGGEAVDLVVVNQRKDGAKLCCFRVDPQSRELVRVDRGDIPTGPNYGGCLYHSLKTDKFYAFITSEQGDAEQYELVDDGTGHVIGKKVRSWPIGKSEGAVADDATGQLYVAEEEKGIWQLGAEPQDPTTGQLVIEVGKHGIKGDLEGVTLAKTPDGTYLLFSDQGTSTVHVMPLGGGGLTLRFAVTGAKETDGIDIAMVPLGTEFPRGLFAVHSDDSPSPILLTPMEHVLSALGAN
ncbi:MAG: phytase [Planctomycetaceae bacterium]|nr:phytase [Planctomycetaceae bacterium]